MKNKIKIIDFFEFKDGKIVFFIELLGGYFNIEDVFVNNKNSLKFQIKGIGMENLPSSDSKSILIELLNTNINVSEFKDKEFIKE
ncbi:hypothetical protein [Lacinutrix salivirga]